MANEVCRSGLPKPESGKRELGPRLTLKMPKTQDTISFPVKALSLDIAEVNEAGLDHRTPMLSSCWPLDQLAENMVVLPPATV